jgi:hypothetical protein
MIEDAEVISNGYSPTNDACSDSLVALMRVIEKNVKAFAKIV